MLLLSKFHSVASASWIGILQGLQFQGKLTPYIIDIWARKSMAGQLNIKTLSSWIHFSIHAVRESIIGHLMLIPDKFRQ
jgi:hypothetical protein